MSFTNLLNITAAVSRSTHTQDAIGAVVTTWTQTIAAVPCRIRHLTFQEVEMSGTVGLKSTDRLYCLYGPDIREGDLISANGKSYAVVHCDDKDQMHHHLEIELREVHE